jgi:hypothetical protein
MENLNTNPTREKPKEDTFYIKLAKWLLAQEQKDGEPISRRGAMALGASMLVSLLGKIYMKIDKGKKKE